MKTVKYGMIYPREFSFWHCFDVSEERKRTGDLLSQCQAVRRNIWCGGFLSGGKACKTGCPPL